MKCAGVDGCRGGWIVVAGRDLASSAETFLCVDFDEVIEQTLGCEIVAVDMPIGLLEGARKGGRCCDQDARAVLNSSSKLNAGSRVFSPPIRGVLETGDYKTACQISRASSPAGLKISQQAYGLLGKLREVDHRMSSRRQRIFREAHPELAFQALRQEAELDLQAAPLAGKKTDEGRQQRIDLLAGDGFKNIERVLSLDGKRWPRSRVGRDDLLDAAVLLWTAQRIARGDAERLPAGIEPPKDARGLRMEIWY